MRMLMEPPPRSHIDTVTELLHGVSVEDPYRWLEDQDSPCTREWIAAQTRYARLYLDSVPGRERIRNRARQLLDVETFDSFQKLGNRYFFRKREPGQEQPCIYFRDGWDGRDQLLIDPSLRGSGSHTAVKPLRVSSDGRFLLYEVKQGGERTGTFELLNIETRETLPDVLPRGYLRGFAFAPDSQAFYYVHESLKAQTHHRCVAYRHVFGTPFADDQEVFRAGEGDQLRLHIVPGATQMGFLVVHFDKIALIDFCVWPFESASSPEFLIRHAPYKFVPLLLRDGRILALTDRDTSNMRIVEIRRRKDSEPDFIDIVPSGDVPIQSWAVCGTNIVVSYLRNMKTEIMFFDFSGRKQRSLPVDERETTRILFGTEDEDELLLENESFTKPIQIYLYSTQDSELKLLSKRRIPFGAKHFDHTQVWFPAKDGTTIPMFLVGRKDVLKAGVNPTVMTSYGGFGVPVMPQFSVLVAFLMEHGCLFALPNIRGGSEFGLSWHTQAKRRNRQAAFDDFVSAAEWLIETGRTQPDRLAIFGGSNSGLLVGAVMTQRPELFGAVLCMVPMLDMIRYHLFNGAHAWKDEFGTAEDAADFAALIRYSPYHNVRDGTAYPATMIVSGDADQNCNALHARKMTARLQGANASNHPIFLDYSAHRGHSPVLPLTERIEALTDRLSFLSDQLQLNV